MVIPVRTVIYTVTEKDSVRAIELSPEFCRHKPAVMASARLAAVCEWPCMEQLREELGPHQCSLGVFGGVPLVTALRRLPAFLPGRAGNSRDLVARSGE